MKRPKPTQRPFPLRSAVAVVAACGACAGCANPVGPIDSDYGRHVPLERLRNVQRFDKDSHKAPDAEQKVTPDARPKSPFVGVATVPLTLEQARAAALTNNLDLKVALVNPTLQTEALKQEEAKFEAVFRPAFFYQDAENPTLDTTTAGKSTTLDFGAGVDIPLRTGGRVSVDFTETKADNNNPFFTLNTSYSSVAALRLSQPLLRNAGRRASTYSIRIAAYNQQISEAQTKLEVIRQLAAVDRSYWRLKAAQWELQVRQKQYDLADAQLEKARRRVAAGDLPNIEIIRAESGLASRLTAIITAENAVLQQQREIKRIVNIPGLDVRTKTVIETKTEPDSLKYDFDPDGLSDTAVANRMEMLELELQLAQDYSTIEFNKNQALPLLTMDYQYNFTGLAGQFQPSMTRLGEGQFETWQMGVSGQVPIGNEAAKARVQQAILTRLQRLSSKDARRQSIEQEVLNAIDSANAGWQSIQASRQAVYTSTRELEAEQRQFDAGARTSTDVLDAATRLADAESSLIRAVADYQISQVDLAFATGTLLGAAKLDWTPRDPRNEYPRPDPTNAAFPYTPWETAPEIGQDPPPGEGPVATDIPPPPEGPVTPPSDPAPFEPVPEPVVPPVP